MRIGTKEELTFSLLIRSLSATSWSDDRLFSVFAINSICCNYCGNEIVFENRNSESNSKGGSLIYNTRTVLILSCGCAHVEQRAIETHGCCDTDKTEKILALKYLAALEEVNAASDKTKQENTP